MSAEYCLPQLEGTIAIGAHARVNGRRGVAVGDNARAEEDCITILPLVSPLPISEEQRRMNLRALEAGHYRALYGEAVMRRVCSLVAAAKCDGSPEPLQEHPTAPSATVPSRAASGCGSRLLRPDVPESLATPWQRVMQELEQSQVPPAPSAP